MSNMKRVNEFFEELKQQKMNSAIVLVKSYLDEGKTANAEHIIQGALKELDALRDKITEFITTEDALVMEPYNGEVIFTYKGERFMITLDKTFNEKSSDIGHLWCITDGGLDHVDWFGGSYEIENLIDKYLKTDKQEVSLIPVEYYIWSEFKHYLDKYISQLK